MKKILITLLCFAISSMAFSQVANTNTPVVKNKVIRRINIKHADPYLIMLLLKGGYISQTEYSTIMKLRGG